MIDLFKKVRIYGITTSIIYALNEIIKVIARVTKKTYSQNGEDLIIDKLLKNKKNGFYIDVGAYDPVRFSNTKRFYDKGWSGINIEPDTGNYMKFLKTRKRDINLNIGINTKAGRITFYKFFPDTLSTFSSKSAKDYINLGYSLISKKTIKVSSLSKIIKEKCKGKVIDFLSVDTEGFDFKVLQSNDWKLSSPRVICVESVIHANKGKSTTLVDVDQYLLKKGYKKEFDNNLNSIYILKKK